MNIQAFEEIGAERLERPPVLVVRHGRGRTGGSTFLDFLIQKSRRAGRDVIVGDGDKGNATLSAFYPPGEEGAARQPKSADIADVSEWVTSLCGEMEASKASLVLDLGGGDRVLAEHARDMDLPEFCEAAGAVPLADKDDFDHVFSIFQAGYFACPHALLVLNYNLVRAGKNRASAFEWLDTHPGYLEMAKTAVGINMERLACMDAMREAGLSFYDVIDNKRGNNGKAFDLARQFQVQVWVNKLEKQFRDAGVEEWLP